MSNTQILITLIGSTTILLSAIISAIISLVISKRSRSLEGIRAGIDFSTNKITIMEKYKNKLLDLQ